jgi:hypothetical protein
MPKNKQEKIEKTPLPTTSSNWNASVRAADNEDLYKAKKDKGEFTAGEMGLPEEEDEDNDNRDGKGPLQQEGEGNRQNSQLAELEQDIDAKADLEQRR